MRNHPVCFLFASMILAGICNCGDGSGNSDSDVDDPPVKHIFVTSAGYNGNLLDSGGGATGLEGADNICNLHAMAAEREGTYVAWLSDSTTDAIDRIQDVGPWYLFNGQKAFNSKANLMTTPLVPINVDEKGGSTGLWVWTGTELGGRRHEDTCADWTGAIGFGRWGQLSSTDSCWTSCGRHASHEKHRLYCIQQ